MHFHVSACQAKLKMYFFTQNIWIWIDVISIKHENNQVIWFEPYFGCKKGENVCDVGNDP